MWFVAGCQDATVHIWKVSPGNMPGRLQIVVGCLKAATEAEEYSGVSRYTDLFAVLQ